MRLLGTIVTKLDQGLKRATTLASGANTVSTKASPRFLMILVKHCRTLPRMLQTEIYTVRLYECCQEVIKTKNILYQS